MDSHEFNALKHAIACDLGCGSANTSSNTDYFDVDGVSIFLTENKDSDIDHINSISCLVELGTIDDTNRLKTYQDLLALNTVSGQYANASFGYNADKDCAILISQIPTSSFHDHTQVVDLLNQFVQIAHAFNENHGATL